MTLTPENIVNLRLLANRAEEEVRHAVIEGDILTALLDYIEELTEERDGWQNAAKAWEQNANLERRARDA